MKENIYVQGLNVIPIRDLGEWAWNNSSWVFKDLAKDYYAHKYSCSLFEFIENQLNHNFDIHELPFKIAIACLGKPEVEKRLKELK